MLKHKMKAPLMIMRRKTQILIKIKISRDKLDTIKKIKIKI